MGNELEDLKNKNTELEKEIINLKNDNDSLVKDNAELTKSNDELQKDNDSLVETQQGLKAKIKELSTDKPKITSGHRPGSVKYVRQVRVKKKTA